jgi:hypothetical protein
MRAAHTLTSWRRLTPALTLKRRLHHPPLKNAQASPATVSRVGMIFCEVRNLGWQPLRDVWLDTLPPALQEHRALLVDLFAWLFPPAVYFVQKVKRHPKCRTIQSKFMQQ